MGVLLYSKMKLLLLPVLATVALAGHADYAKLQFAQFREQYGKVYKTRTEHQMRFDIFQAMYLGGYKRLPTPAGNFTTVSKPAKDLPTEVDWRKQGVITDVKNQGQCGSCWAFCTTEMIESYAGIATGSTPELSSQQVTSCTPNPLSCGGTGGCMGSIAQLGYTYIQLFGHVTEEDYPYTSGTTTETGDCMYDFMNTAPVIGITGYNVLPSNDQDAVLTHLAEVGPLAVSVYASGWGSYSSGV